MCIAVICSPVYDVINAEIKVTFLIKPKKSGQKFEYLKNEKSF